MEILLIVFLINIAFSCIYFLVSVMPRKWFKDSEQKEETPLK